MSGRLLLKSSGSRLVTALAGASLVAAAAIPALAIDSTAAPLPNAVAALPPTQLDSYVSSAVLPFTMPSTATLRASSKKVFANWVSTLPVSIDNQDPATDYYARNYLNPNGEGGKHITYGGFMRDRPLGRAPRSGDWRLEDMKTEVRQAISAGIDGFTMVIYTLPGNPTATTVSSWNAARLMMQAASAVDPGFKIIPMPDMTTLSGETSQSLASHMAYLATFPSIYRTADGRALFSPFNTEKHTAVWWSSWLTSMKTTYGTPTALWPTFQNEMANLTAFAPFIDGIAGWGTRNPDSSRTTWDYMGPKDRIARIHAAGEKWMSPVSVQDARPRTGIFWEALNTQNLRNTWNIAIDGQADWAQLVTWNDISEATNIQPSMSHGWSLMDLMAYYITWFKTGQAPTITKDAIYLTHREHWVADRPTFAQQTVFSSVIGSTPSRNSIEALVFLTAAATVTIKAGSTTFSCSAPAGVSTCVAPLAAGTVSAEVVRSGVKTSSVTSPWTVSHTPYVTDLQYVGVSSLREGTSAPSAPLPTSAAISPTADTYVEEMAPSSNFDWSSQVATRGSKGEASYLRFSLPAAPAGKTLTAATLVMRTCVAAESGSVDRIAVSVLTAPWSASTVTWKTRPVVSSTVLGYFPTGTRPDTVYSVPLTLSPMSAAQGSAISLALTSTGTDNLRLWSTGHASAAMHPKLVLTYG